MSTVLDPGQRLMGGLAGSSSKAGAAEAEDEEKGVPQNSGRSPGHWAAALGYGAELHLQLLSSSLLFMDSSLHAHIYSPQGKLGSDPLPCEKSCHAHCT